MELGGQAGYDTDGQLPAQPRLPWADGLRYVSRANISYLAPIGNGLKLTAGLFNSFIGYESFYAKDNPNYTRLHASLDCRLFALLSDRGRCPVSGQ